MVKRTDKIDSKTYQWNNWCIYFTSFTGRLTIGFISPLKLITEAATSGRFLTKNSMKTQRKCLE